jgi:hypothetical protein
MGMKRKGKKEKGRREEILKLWYERAIGTTKQQRE